MSNTPLSLFVAFLVSAALAGSGIARADSFYKDKTITIVVGFSPGGGYDSYARVLARFMPKHIPGHPKVIVENQPGAGSLVAARSVNATQPMDGTVMVTFNAGLITQSIVQPDKVKLNFGKYAWIGAPTPEFRVCYGYGPNGVKTWDSMMRRKRFVLGSEGTGSGDYINGMTLRAVFDAPVKLVLGFPGSADTRLAIERGELDGGCGALSSIPADWLSTNTAHLFVRFTKERPPGMPKSARYINTFATTQAQRDLLGVLDAVDEVGRPFAMSARVPVDRIEIMRKAFEDTMKDPEFLAESKKEQLPVHPITGENIARIVTQIETASPAIIAKAAELYKQ